VHKEANKIASKSLYLQYTDSFLECLATFVESSIMVSWVVIIAMSHYFNRPIKSYMQNPILRNKSIPVFYRPDLHIVVLYCCCVNSDLFGHHHRTFKEIIAVDITQWYFVSYHLPLIMPNYWKGMSDRIELDHKSLPMQESTLGIIERLLCWYLSILGRMEEGYWFIDYGQNESVGLTTLRK